jgi:tRNA(Ile)-lysidine synthase
MSNVLLQKVHHAIRAMGIPRSPSGIVIAVSGGADSVALLHALVELKRRGRLDCKLHAAHFNHRLRGAESDEDERFVRGLAGRLKASLTVARAKRAPVGSKHSEDELRSVRYRFLYGVAAQHRARFVAVAHTLDDQAETVLMRIVRGAGIRGLAAMREKRELLPHSMKHAKASMPSRKPPVWLVRPFLSVSREEILHYLKGARVGFREDSSNRDIRYLRNFVRSRVMPLLRELNPSVARAFFDLAAFSRQYADFVDFAATEATSFISPKRLKDRTFLKVCDLVQFPPAVRAAVIERELEQLSGAEFTSVHRLAVESLVTGTAGTKTAELVGGVCARRVYGLLTLERKTSHPNERILPAAEGSQPDEASPQALKVPGTTRLAKAGVSIHTTLLSGRNAAKAVAEALTHKDRSGGTVMVQKHLRMGGETPPTSRSAEECAPDRVATLSSECMDADRLVFPLRVRTWRAGDRFRPLGQEHSKKLHDYFVDRKVPRESRAAIPLVCSGREIVWVVGLGIADGVKLTGGTARVLEVRCAARQNY